MAVRQTNAAQVQFGPFELDLHALELKKRGHRLKLGPQPIKILALLAGRPGELVTREELQQAVWGHDTFIDFEQGLNFCIRQLRATLDDDAESPRYIDTVPRRGYRFVGKLRLNGSKEKRELESNLQPSEKAEPAQLPIAILEPPDKRSRKARRRLSINLLASLSMMLILVIASVLWKSSVRPAVTPSRVMIAVLPFDNLSSDRSQDYLAEGITEELITQLGRWNPERLGVIARTSSDLYKHANKTVAQVGRELSVDYVVEGSARRDGNQVRITAQLIQVSDQTHLWAKEYDSDERNVLALENDVAADVADKIKVKLSRRAKEETRTVDMQAREAYLKGRYYWNQLSCKDFETALPLFREAVQRDTNFALGEASLAVTYFKQYDFGCRPPEEVMPKAKQAALRAIQLDDQLGEAHAALGIIATQFDWDWVTGERELKLATELSPNNAVAHSWYGARLCEKRLWQQCFAEQKLAHELDPVAEITNILAALMLYFDHRYDDAVEGWQKTLELHPNSLLSLWGIAGAYEQKGDDIKASETYLKVAAADGTPEPELTRLRAAIQRDGLKGYWNEHLRLATKRQTPDPCSTTEIYAHLRERQETLDFLERSRIKHCRGMARLQIEPLYDFVRSEPGFQALMREMAFPNSNKALFFEDSTIAAH